MLASNGCRVVCDGTTCTYCGLTNCGGTCILVK